MAKKRAVTIFFLSLLALILVVCVIGFSGVTVSSRGDIYLDDYSDYYLYKKDIMIRGFLNIDISGDESGYKIWFLPGQKAKLLDRIEADVRASLDDLTANNSDLVQGYEISEDFQDISIYL